MYTLRQMVGKRRTKSGVEEVKRPIDEILKQDATKRNGVRRIGLISRHDGAPISFTAFGLSEGEKAEAVAAVTELRKEQKLATAEAHTSVPEVPMEPVEVDEDE